MPDEINKDFVGHFNYRKEQEAIASDNAAATSGKIIISEATKKKLKEYWDERRKAEDT